MKSILVVDDNKLNLATARTVLSDSYKVIPVMKGEQAISYLENGECDIILMDINMPDMDGFEVIKKIREMEHCKNIPVIFLTADNDVETEIRCFREGAIDFIAKPFVPEIMLSRVSRALELEELHRNLAASLEQKTREVSAIMSKAQQDALTGLWDREYTEEAVNRMIDFGTAGFLMMMDIDNFKSVNDFYGHESGDKVLQTLADVLRDTAAKGDVLCRIGGDEFIVFMKGVTSKGEAQDRAMEIISQLNNQIDEFGFDVSTSISIGIAQTPEDGTKFSELYSCADKALYYVKRNGKNSYHFYSDKLREENANAQEIVGIQDLKEIMGRDDTGKGAYFLSIDSFQYVYNFIRRLEERNDYDASVLLFTISERDNSKAMELLNKVVCTSMRCSDVATKYSSKQTIAVLLDADKEHAVIAAERIMKIFNQEYKGDPVHIIYDIASLDSWNFKKPPKHREGN